MPVVEKFDVGNSSSAQDGSKPRGMDGRV